MELLQNAVIILIKFLIAIGNVTLLVLSSIIYFLKKIIKRIVNSVKSILRFFTLVYKKTAYALSGLRRFKIKFKKDKVAKPGKKKIKKAKPIKIFPFPFFVKAKYFFIASCNES